MVPLLYFFLTVIIIVIWIGCLFCVLSLNDFAPSKTIPQAKSIIWTGDGKHFGLVMFMFFGIIWICAQLEYTC